MLPRNSHSVKSPANDVAFPENNDIVIPDEMRPQAFGDWRDTFISGLSRGLPIDKAFKASRAPISRSSLFMLRRDSPAFAEQWKAAKEAGHEFKLAAADHAMWSRHVEGTDEPVTFQGEIKDTYKKFDTSAGGKWLSAHDDRYKNAPTAQIAIVNQGVDYQAIQGLTPELIAELQAQAHERLLAPPATESDSTAPAEPEQETG